MKLKLIFIFIIFVCLNFITASTQPRCITTDNIYANSVYTKPTDGKVNWWFLNQLINEDAIYSDSSLQSTETVLEIKGYKTRDIQESPLYNTYKQSFDDLNYHSITYNDAVDKNEPSIISGVTQLSNTKGGNDFSLAGSAHSKGFFIWNEFGGIHVIHSFPESPTYDKNIFVPKGKSKQLSQHAMCTELTPNELKIIPKYLIYSNSILQTIDNQRLNCWQYARGKGSVKKCYVSLDAVIGTYKDENQNNHEINKIGKWDFEGKFDDQTKERLDSITTFENMETFMGDTILKSSDWMKLDSVIEINKWKQIAFKIAGNDITSKIEISADESSGNNVHYFKAMDYRSNGKYFLQTSNGHLRANYLTPSNEVKDILKQSKYEIIWKYIRNHQPYSQVTNWISHTMADNKVKNDYNKWFKSGDGIDLVYKFQSETIQTSSDRKRTSLKEVSTSEDHSKLFYGSSADNKFNVFCVGDLNWQGVQALRGGGALCRTDLGYLVDFFSRRVSWLRSRNNDDAPNKFGILNSLFTVRSTSVLDWINTEFKEQYKLDGTNLIEITPKLNVKASSKLNGLNAMLKLKVTKPTDYTQTTIESDVETEPFSLEVYPSITDKVFICSIGTSNCNFESSIKKLVLQDLKLPISYIIPNLEGKSFSSNNMNVIIKVKKPTTLNWESKDELTNLVISAKIAEKYVDEILMFKPAPIQSISLIRDDEKDDFIKKFSFPLQSNPNGLGQICNGAPINSILFNQDCHDLLFLCLYYKESVLDNILTLPKDDVITLLTDKLKNAIGNNIKMCLVSENGVVIDSEGQSTDDDAKKAEIGSQVLEPMK